MLDFQATGVVGVQVWLEIRLRVGGFSCQPLGVTEQVAGTRRDGGTSRTPLRGLTGTSDARVKVSPDNLGY